MYKSKKITVIIPAYNEEDSIPYVLAEIPRYIDEVIVIDNNSSDNTKCRAEKFNVSVVNEERIGYGSACLKGISEIENTDIAVFLDADYTDYPGKMNMLLDPIIDEEYDFVLSNRFTDGLEKGTMSLPQYYGNKLAVGLVKLFWGFEYRDLGPFRAIKFDKLKSLGMEDKDFGWTIEMQIKAITNNLKIMDIDMPYRKRVKGRSKISGTLKGVFFAGTKIVYIILKERLKLKKGEK